MNAFQKDLDVTSNNMANISTRATGCCEAPSTTCSIRRWIRETQTRRWATVLKPTARGSRVLTRESSKTEQDLDFAILGKAYFAVESEDEDAGGAILYKGTGRFRYRPQTKETYLTTRDGHYVLSRDGDPSSWNTRRWGKAAMERSSPPMRLDLSGLSEVIGLYTCENPDGLIPVGKRTYTGQAPFPENGSR